MGELEISRKFVSRSSDGNFVRIGRRIGTRRKNAARCRVADNRKATMSNVHDTSRLPNFIPPMKFVKQKKTDAQKKHLIISKNTNELKHKVRENGNEDAIEGKPATKQGRFEPKNYKSEEEPAMNYIPCKSNSNIVEHKSIERTTLPLSDATSEKVVLNRRQKNQLESMVLRQRQGESAISIINSSSGFCKCSHEYVFEQCWTPKDTLRYTCSLYVNGVLVGKSHASDKKTAKHASATSALELLRTTQQTLLITSNPGDLNSAISRNDIISRTDSIRGEQKIADTNLGHQLLRKMGWKGVGGLGKTGSGISTPVAVSETFGRAGLGVDKADDHLISFKDAQDVIRNYASSQSSNELTFSPELTKDERLKIHQLSRRYGLRSKSYNDGDVRYLVVSRKMSAAALVNELITSGGKKGSVRLVGPMEEKSLSKIT